MLKHIHEIVKVEQRPYCHRDFTTDETRDQPYYMKYGTFRNKNSILRKKGIVDLSYYSVLAFYSLKGVKFGRQKTMTPSMTRNHMVVSPVTGVTIEDNDVTTLPIYREILKLPREKRALHDIHYRFQVSDIWKILAYGYEIDLSNQA